MLARSASRVNSGGRRATSPLRRKQKLQGRFINSWNEFLAALIFMSDQDNFTLPIFLTMIRSGLRGAIDRGALQAGVIVSIIPGLGIFLLLQRYYMDGLTGGAVKT